MFDQGTMNGSGKKIIFRWRRYWGGRGFFLCLAYALALVICALPISVGAVEAAPSWTGTWDTVWESGTARMVLVQAGNQVTGSYDYNGGTISGTASGNSLTGTWTESNNSGSFEFVVAADGRSFSGTWDGTEFWSGIRTTHFASPEPTPAWADYLGRFRIDGVDAQPGDEIAFFDPQGVLCGRFTVEQAGQYGIVRVYGDDQGTAAVDEGAVAGDILTVKIWDARRMREITGADVSLHAGLPPVGSSFLPAVLPPVWQDRQGYALNVDTAAHFAAPMATPYAANYLGQLLIDGYPADIGDEVAVFDAGGILCGHTRITTPGQYGIVQIYGDDPATAAVIEGATEDGVLTFKVWSKKTGKEYPGDKLRLVPGTAAGSFLPSLAPPIWRVDAGYVLNIEAWEQIVPPPVATVDGAPASPTKQTDASLTVGGAGVVAYKYKLDGGVYSGEVPVAEPIVLSGLTEGGHTVYVLGKNTYGDWQAEAAATAASWLVDTQAPQLTVAEPPEGYKTHLLAVTLSGQVQDITAVTVSVTLEGAVYSPAVTGGAFSQVLSFPARNRDYVIEVRAVDALGQTTSLQRTVTITNTPPVLEHATVGAPAGTAVAGTLTATDADADPLTIREGPPLWYFYICSTMYPWSTYGYIPLTGEEMLAVITGGHKGMLVLDQATGRYLYTPRPGATGEDIFVFRANDATEDSAFAYLKIDIGAVASDGQEEGPTATPLAALPGDVSGDGKVDLADAILSLQTAAGGAMAVNVTGDVNGDQRIGLAEALYALQYVSGLRGPGAAAYAVADYFPVQVGDWRDFRDDVTGIVYRTLVSEPKTIGGASTFVFSYASGSREYYTADATGLKLHGVYEPAGSLPGEYLFDAPLLLVKGSAKIGDRHVSSTYYHFSLYGVVNDVLVTTATTLVGLQDVTTQNGVVKDCLLVSLERTETLAGQTQPIVSATTLYWFAKDIGCVRQVDQSRSVTISVASVQGAYRSF